MIILNNITIPETMTLAVNIGSLSDRCVVVSDDIFIPPPGATGAYSANYVSVNNDTSTFTKISGIPSELYDLMYSVFRRIKSFS
jgi:hypothetical protein